MNGAEFKEIRKRLGLGQAAFAREIGYTGSDANNTVRIRKYEHLNEVPLHIARFVWLIEQWTYQAGQLPDWPDHLRVEDEDEPWT